MQYCKKKMIIIKDKYIEGKYLKVSINKYVQFKYKKFS